MTKRTKYGSLFIAGAISVHHFMGYLFIPGQKNKCKLSKAFDFKGSRKLDK